MDKLSKAAMGRSTWISLTLIACRNHLPMSPLMSPRSTLHLPTPLNLSSTDSVMRLQDSLSRMPWAQTCHITEHGSALSSVTFSEHILVCVCAHTHQDVSHKRTAKCQRKRGKEKNGYMHAKQGWQG